MLQSIQYCGSGPPTYVYSQNAVGADNSFFHVFAAEMREYESQREHRDEKTRITRRGVERKPRDYEDFKVLDSNKKENLQDIYQKEYGKRELFLWKQR